MVDRADGPGLFRDRSLIEAREREIDEPHVAPLNAWVRSLRERLGPAAIVPWFDPWDGGVEARILWLLEAPGPKSTKERGGSGFISCNNNDQTARHTFMTRTEAGVPRRLVVHWNAIPYYLGSDTKLRAHSPSDVAAAGPLLAELLALLPSLRVVLLGGAAAQAIWRDHGPTETTLKTIDCPHPSATNMNTRPHLRPTVVDAWRTAGALAEI